jgi:trans-AT polyketide synthase/acyltransferase/oxidoreductase domain-containing protein
LETESPTRVRIVPEALGSAAFRRAHGVRYAYAAGAMYQGIASPALVARMARSGLLSYLGNGGLPREQAERDLVELVSLVPSGAAFGVNLLHRPDDPSREDEMVELLLRFGVRRVEAAAYLEITPALAAFRLSGLRLGANGRIDRTHLVLAKVSRPEIARLFFAPIDPAIAKRLVESGRITSQQAQWSRHVPVADDLCVEADSGGHTDQGVLYALLPAVLAARKAAALAFPAAAQVRIGAAGGLGTPHAIAAAFVLGADFVLTGSINQCTLEARTSDKVKQMLQSAGARDTAIVPAGDMLELGAKMQVLRRGLLFPARAAKLYELYRECPGWSAIPEATRTQVESRYFQRPITEILADLKARCSAERWASAEANPRQMLAMICRWYFHHTTQWALCGEPGRELDYQIHCGPALGAFNALVEGTPMEDWRNRHADEIAAYLMNGAAEILARRFEEFQS